MKICTILTLLLGISLASFAKEKEHSPIRLLSVKSDICYFKVDKELINATVEVYSSDGTLIMSDTIRHSKTIIDFYKEAPGHFIIKIVKDNQEETFEYLKPGMESN